jgi:mRNA-degrading endonuclease HigB of HigAB toxin-antitoxin module
MLLFTAIDYSHQIVLVKWLGTHAEYDGIDAKVVKFQKERYDNSRDSN